MAWVGKPLLAGERLADALALHRHGKLAGDFALDQASKLHHAQFKGDGDEIHGYRKRLGIVADKASPKNAQNAGGHGDGDGLLHAHGNDGVSRGTQAID